MYCLVFRRMLGSYTYVTLARVKKNVANIKRIELAPAKRPALLDANIGSANQAHIKTAPATHHP
jgi:hypothetical protein